MIFSYLYKIKALRYISEIIILLSVSVVSYPRWSTYEDAPLEIKFYNRSVHINSDGSAKETIELQVKILKEQGRNSWVNYLTYNTSSNKINILSAKTIYDGKEYLVDQKCIEDKPLASSPKGFDQNNQILLAFPFTEIGSELYLKYENRLIRPVLPNFYSTEFVYGLDGFWKSSQVIVTSELPFYVTINDPENVLELKGQSKLPSKKIEIVLKQPVFKQIIDEPNTNLDPKKLPWVTISTFNDWHKLANMIIPEYEKIINQAIPADFQAILDDAKAIKNPYKRFNLIMAKLMDKIQYWGDWRSVNGQYFPRSLKAISADRLGDCKDFATLLSALLRNLGYKSHVALVRRGLSIYPDPSNLPSLANFNHAFVNVTLPNGTLWLDPTNFASMSKTIFPDVADREVLILDPTNPRLNKTPTIMPSQNQYWITQNWDLNVIQKIRSKGILKLKGVAALELTGAELNMSKEAVDNLLVNIFGSSSKITNKKVDTPNLQSRIVKDLFFKFEFEQRNSSYQTTAGTAFNFYNFFLSNFYFFKEGQVADFILGLPKRIYYKQEVENINIVTQGPFQCFVHSPWLEANRKFYTKNNKAILEDQITIKKFRIRNDELKTHDFSSFLLQLDRCFLNGFAVIFKERS